MDGRQEIPVSLDPGLRRIAGILGDLGVSWFVGGSLASSLHGAFRATADVDFIVALEGGKLDPFAEACSQDFYVDVDFARGSLGLGRPFNLIHIGTSFKFDIFPLTTDPFHQSQIARVEWLPCPLPGLEDLRLPFCSAEDTILAKLAWYRAGGGVSDRQWSDLEAMRDVQAGRLDLDYLRRWAAHLGVSAELHRLLTP